MTASTIAITTNSATSVSLGNAIVMPANSTLPSAMHSALVRPISKAARNAPGIEPRPPTTVTTNASAMTVRSMPRLAGSRGNCSAPASPARNAPSANTAVKSFASSIPSAAVSTRFSDAARIRTAEARARHEPRERDQHQRADGDEEQVVLRNRAAEELERAGESRRARPEQVFGAPDRQHGVAHDQHDRERRRELQQFRRRVEPLQQQRFDQCADDGDDECGEHHAEPERDGAAADGGREEVAEPVRAVRAQHVQRAMREVDDARDAEDQREAGGDQEQRRRRRQAVQQLEEKRRERHADLLRIAQMHDKYSVVPAKAGTQRLSLHATGSPPSRGRPKTAFRRMVERRTRRITAAAASSAPLRRTADSPCRRRSASRPSRPCRP